MRHPIRLICRAGHLVPVLLLAWAGTLGAVEILSPSDGDTFDVGEVITFSARAICPTTEISWTFGDGETAKGTTVTHSYDAANEYTVTASDPSGSDSITITIGPANQPPTASAAATPTVAAVNQSIQFSSEGSFDPEGGALTYLWSFGDNGTSTDANPSHSYEASGHYTVTLTVADPEGAEGADTVAVTAVGVSFDTNPVMVGVSKTEAVTAAVTPSDAYGHVSFTTADSSIATVSPAAASNNEQGLTVTGVKMGTTVLQAKVGEYPCGSAAISVGQMVVVRITPDPGILIPGERATFTAAAFAAVKGYPLIPHDYSPDLATLIGTEITVGSAKGVYLGPTPVAWRLEGGPNAEAFIPQGVPTHGVSSVEVEATTWATGNITPDLRCHGCNGDNADLKTVELKVELDQSCVTLVEKNGYNAHFIPDTVEVLFYVIEIKWAKKDAEWHRLGMAQSVEFTHRVAGHFKVRARAKLRCGMVVCSEEANLEVTFPTGKDIAEDGTVKAKMDAAWASTMAAATATSRREEGFWVWLNTGAGGGYRTGDTVVGEAVGPDEVATCPLPLRPDDNVGNPITAGSYPVAQFHTHPPQFWSKIGRWAGPSRSDKNRAKKDEVPGLVYDYVGDRRWIPAGHPLDAPAKVYLYGLERRSTPE